MVIFITDMKERQDWPRHSAEKQHSEQTRGLGLTIPVSGPAVISSKQTLVSYQ